MRRFISLISLLAFVVLAIASISASRVASAAGVVAGGMASITRHFPAKVGGYDNMTFEITIAKEPGFNGRTYWAHQFGFAPPADGGYIGLQIRNANDKVVNFSIWNATGWRDSSGSQCARFGHEGEGIQCWRSYAWREGVTYLLRVERVGAADWRASIVDTSTNATTPIATITQPENFVSGITSLSEWVENFAQGNDAHPSCLAVPPAVAVYGIPTAQNGTVKPTSSTHTTYGNCKAIATSYCSSSQNCVLSANPPAGIIRKQLLNAAGNLCLDFLGGGNHGGLYYCDKNPNQLVSQGQDFRLILSDRTNQCLTVDAQSRVITAQCNGSDIQRWVRLSGTSAFLHLQSHTCMDAANGAVVEAPVQTTHCLANTYQQWIEQ